MAVLSVLPLDLGSDPMADAMLQIRCFVELLLTVECGSDSTHLFTFSGFFFSLSRSAKSAALAVALRHYSASRGSRCVGVALAQALVRLWMDFHRTFRRYFGRWILGIPLARFRFLRFNSLAFGLLCCFFFSSFASSFVGLSVPPFVRPSLSL